MPTEYRIRPVGRPKVERDTNGLRKITRKYVVDGVAVSVGSIEDDVFLPFGTQDREYKDTTLTLGPGYTSGMTYVEDGLGSTANIHAYLVEQMVTPAEEVTQAYLTRVYQELDSTPNPVQVGEDAIKLNDAGRLTIQRKFIVKNQFTNHGTTFEPSSALTPFKDHYDPDRIGVDYINVTVDGTVYKCFLGGVQSEEHEVYTLFTESFFEDAILSQTIEYRNGLKPDHKLEIRTVRAIAGSSELSKPSASLGPGDGAWYLVSEREGSGSADFGAAGKPVHTRVWAKGRGIVSLRRQYRHNGALEIVSIRALGEQSTPADAGFSGNGAAFNRVSEDQQESSGHQVFSDTYAAGEGLIATRTQTKGDIEIVSETWISAPDGSHSSELENITGESISKRDGYDIHTLTGTTQEDGVISLSRTYHHNGDLEIVRITKLGSTPTVEDCGTAGNGDSFVLIAEGKNESGILTSYTGTFAAGKGTIQTGISNSGKVTTTSYTSLNTDFPSETYDHTEADRDGYILRTYKTYDRDTSFTSDKTKSWINKFVYRENTKELKDEIPSPFVEGASEISGSYTKAGPADLWSTSDVDVVADSAGVISSNVRYVASGNYFTVTKRVASASGASASTYAPSNSVQVGEARSYERGWVMDTFTWAAISSSTVTMASADTIPWTLPGIIKVSSDFRGDDVAGKISQTSPSRISIPVVKTTQLSTTEPAIPSVLPTPWAGIDASLAFKTKKDPYIVDKVFHNWVYMLATIRVPGWDSFHGFLLADGHIVDLSGWSVEQYNSDASDAYLSASVNVAFTDGVTTIYRLDTVRGSPLLDTSAT